MVFDVRALNQFLFTNFIIPNKIQQTKREDQFVKYACRILILLIIHSENLDVQRRFMDKTKVALNISNSEFLAIYVPNSLNFKHIEPH